MKPLAVRWPTVAASVPLVAVAYVWLVNAWASDDAYITFRVVDNFLAGHGLTWNPGERVQAYTNPLWMLIVAALTAILGDVYWAAMTASAAATIGAVWLAAAAVGPSLRARGLLVAVLLSSKAFVDYTSSGLENPLTYLLLAWMLRMLFHDSNAPFADGVRPASDAPGVGPILLAASLAFVNRMDTATLTAPIVLYAWVHAVRGARESWGSSVRTLVVWCSPAWGWLVFATLYYGFPFPNTAYAKLATGVGLAERLQQGLLYYANSLRFDPLTLVTIALGLAAAIAARRRETALAVAGAGVALKLVYVAWVGGDFMSGRFFASAFLVSAVVALRYAHRQGPAWMASTGAWGVALAVVVALQIAVPWSPARSTVSYRSAWKLSEHHGIADERGFYFRNASVLLRLRHGGEGFPVSKRYDRGLRFRRGDDAVTTAKYIGFFGYAAGPERHVVDRMGLAEPLLARLPAVGERIGHYQRPIPAGLIESIETDQNRIADPDLREFYGRIRLATRGPLWSGARLRAIVHLNLVKRAMLDYRAPAGSEDEAHEEEDDAQQP